MKKVYAKLFPDIPFLLEQKKSRSYYEIPDYPPLPEKIAGIYLSDVQKKGNETFYYFF